MANELINVTGMTGHGCTSKIAKALKAIAGVEYVNVSLSQGEASIQYNAHKATTDMLKSAIQAAGYGIASATYSSRIQNSDRYRDQHV